MDTRPEGPSVSEQVEVFRSLSVGGIRGKVRATLSDNQLCFETRHGHALDLKLDALSRVHHHNTTLIPGWLAIVGSILVWVSWRGLSGKAQALMGATGIVLSSAHFITRRPTVTLDTNAGDCHAIFGADSSLIRLCVMVQRIQDGMTLDEARASANRMISDSEYPRARELEDMIATPEPVVLYPIPTIGAFLDSVEYDISDVLSVEVKPPDEEAISVAETELPDWFNEYDQEEEQVDGLLSRALENSHTQRQNVIQNGWQQPIIQQPVYVQPVYQQPSASQAAPPQFLPSFVGINGAHIPSAEPDLFSSPDSSLEQLPEPEPEVSLVESARIDDQEGSVPIDAEIVESQKERYQSLKRITLRNTPKRMTTRPKGRGRLSGKAVIKELVGPQLGRINALGGKLLRRNRTGQALRIQAENSRREIAAESISNLAKSKGGVVDDDDVRDMMAHINGPAKIPQSFGQMVSTEKSTHDGVASIPRLDI